MEEGGEEIEPGSKRIRVEPPAGFCATCLDSTGCRRLARRISLDPIRVLAVSSENSDSESSSETDSDSDSSSSTSATSASVAPPAISLASSAAPPVAPPFAGTGAPEAAPGLDHGPGLRAPGAFAIPPAVALETRAEPVTLPLEAAEALVVTEAPPGPAAGVAAPEGGVGPPKTLVEPEGGVDTLAAADTLLADDGDIAVCLADASDSQKTLDLPGTLVLEHPPDNAEAAPAAPTETSPVPLQPTDNSEAMTQALPVPFQPADNAEAAAQALPVPLQPADNVEAPKAVSTTAETNSLYARMLGGPHRAPDSDIELSGNSPSPPADDVIATAPASSMDQYDSEIEDGISWLNASQHDGTQLAQADAVLLPAPSAGSGASPAPAPSPAPSAASEGSSAADAGAAAAAAAAFASHKEKQRCA